MTRQDDLHRHVDELLEEQAELIDRLEGRKNAYDELAESSTSDTDSDNDIETTQSMSDRTTELVEEHGFDAENLPDEEEDCFDKIYERFTSTDAPENGTDADASADTSSEDDSNAERSVEDNTEDQDVSEPETTESPETADTPDGQIADADAGGEDQPVVNKSEIDDRIDKRLNEHLDKRLDQAVEQKLEAEKKSHERKRQEHAIVNSSAAPFDEDDLGDMNDAAVSRIVEKFDVMSEQAQAQQATAPSESGPTGTYGGVKMPRSNADTAEKKQAPVAGGIRSRLAGDRTNTNSDDSTSNDGGD